MILSIKNEYLQIYMYREIQILKKIIKTYIYTQPIETAVYNSVFALGIKD